VMAFLADLSAVSVRYTLSRFSGQYSRPFPEQSMLESANALLYQPTSMDSI